MAHGNKSDTLANTPICRDMSGDKSVASVRLCVPQNPLFFVMTFPNMERYRSNENCILVLLG